MAMGGTFHCDADPAIIGCCRFTSADLASVFFFFFHHQISLLLTITMAASSSSKVAAQILAGNKQCRITEQYSVTVAEISAAFFYGSCRLLAMHRAINTDAASPPRDPAAFYKHLCWEVDVSPPNHLSIQSTDHPARPFSLPGLPYVSRPITPDTTTMSSTLCSASSGAFALGSLPKINSWRPFAHWTHMSTLTRARTGNWRSSSTVGTGGMMHHIHSPS
jgi:hypothetical protein